jgi:hypothetical protein
LLRTSALASTEKTGKHQLFSSFFHRLAKAGQPKAQLNLNIIGDWSRLKFAEGDGFSGLAG